MLPVVFIPFGLLLRGLHPVYLTAEDMDHSSLVADMITHLKAALQKFFVVVNKLLYLFCRELYRPATIHESGIGEII